jgi:2-iminobutanoate/2-iminopropanoate deaminase
VYAVSAVEQGRQGRLTVRRSVTTEKAPKAIGPYSQAIAAGSLLFCSGQIPIDPASGNLVAGDISVQTRQVLRNLGEVLRAAGASYDEVVRTTVYLVDLGEFSAMNEVYGEFFREPAPARATIQAARLPRDARIEIDAIAVLPVIP